MTSPIPAVAIARDGSTRNTSALDIRLSTGDRAAPEYQGSTIYGLTSFTDPQGQSHLVGTHSKKGQVWDFTTGQVLLDGPQFRNLLTSATYAGAYPTPSSWSGGDSYCATAVWTSPVDGVTRLYLGGWYLLSAPNTGGFSSAWKHTYLLATDDLVNWNVIIDDPNQTGSSTEWEGEISCLIPTQNYLFICRGDGNANLGLYKYDGSAVTLVDSTYAPLKGTQFNDQILIWGSNGNLYTYSALAPATPGANFYCGNCPTSINAIHSTYGMPSGCDAAPFASGTFWGTVGGYMLTDAGRHSNMIFTPVMFGGANTRRLGWRSNALSALGGVIVSSNEYDPADPYFNQANLSTLLYIKPNGEIKVIGTAGYIGGITLHQGRVYWGANSIPHVNIFSAHQAGETTLESRSVEDVLSGPPAPLVDTINYSTTQNGVYGLYGGWPTLGYKQGKLLITPTVAGNLQFYTWDHALQAVTVGSAIAFTANQTQIIDLASNGLITGALIGFTYSGTTPAFTGRISLTA